MVCVDFQYSSFTHTCYAHVPESHCLNLKSWVNKITLAPRDFVYLEHHWSGVNFISGEPQVILVEGLYQFSALLLHTHQCRQGFEIFSDSKTPQILKIRRYPVLLSWNHPKSQDIQCFFPQIRGGCALVTALEPSTSVISARYRFPPSFLLHFWSVF